MKFGGPEIYAVARKELTAGEEDGNSTLKVC